MRMPGWLRSRAHQKQRLRDLRRDIDQEKDEIAAAREIFEEARNRTNDAFVAIERKTAQMRVELALLADIQRGLDGT